MFAPLSENGASETRSFLMNIVFVKFSCNLSISHTRSRSSSFSSSWLMLRVMSMILILIFITCYNHMISSVEESIFAPIFSHSSSCMTFSMEDFQRYVTLCSLDNEHCVVVEEMRDHYQEFTPQHSKFFDVLTMRWNAVSNKSLYCISSVITPVSI